MSDLVVFGRKSLMANSDPKCHELILVKGRCNCTGTTDTVACTLVLGDHDPIECCLCVEVTPTTICVPVSLQVSNGTPFILTDHVPDDSHLYRTKMTGLVLSSGSVTVLCVHESVIYDKNGVPVG